MKALMTIDDFLIRGGSNRRDNYMEPEQRGWHHCGSSAHDTLQTRKWDTCTQIKGQCNTALPNGDQKGTETRAIWDLGRLGLEIVLRMALKPFFWADWSETRRIAT